MIKALLIDDETLARENIKNHLKAFDEIEVIGECKNGFEAFKAIDEQRPDLVFLDIQMPKINGFELLELIEEKPALIFTTAFDEYALKAFETGAVDYLLKPFSRERFMRAVKKSLRQNGQNKSQSVTDYTRDMPERQNRIVVKSGSEIQIIPVDQIHYIQADDDYVKICTAQRKHLKNTTMKFLEESLNPKLFIRIHRSYIINTNELTKIEPYKKNSYLAILKSGAQIPISRSGFVELKDQLGI